MTPPAGPPEHVPSDAPRHRPVLLDEVLAALAPSAGERHIDGTFGAGGYSRAILATGASVLAIDRDPTAIRDGAALVLEYPNRLTLVENRYSVMAEIAADLAPNGIDGVVLDIGVSSMQLDQAERGFSFMSDGPLDMRMGAEGPSAATIVNEDDEARIADILFHLGEERRGRQIARAIVKARDIAPIATTGALAALVEKTIGRRPGDDKHPATRTFQALRIAINDELGELARGLAAAEAILKPGGRLAVVTFHSLEDRIVKRFLARRSGRHSQGSRHGPPSRADADAPSFRIINQRPLTPSHQEMSANPRARSAKLRAATRTEAAPWPAEAADALGLPGLDEDSH